ncbi:hypothetical protein [Paludisphaera sp.]|uniref:hypothetical protein n=1 Tax=Paludisphaera sp. TaxID=2017432 RepID=UPI00301BF7A1
MLTEILGKGGALCKEARSGRIRCPLIIRPTSEDAVTGQIVQTLRVLNSRWWLPDLLNTALGTRRFRRQFHRDLSIEPWVNMPPYPRELLPWTEGSTQVDIVITYENPPTTVFIEAKYGSDVARTTTNGDGAHGYPADQILRNIRVGLLACGYFDRGGSLFESPPRQFVQILLAPKGGHPLIGRYRDPDHLRRSIPHADRLADLPRSPFVGELSFGDIMKCVQGRAAFLTRAERQAAEDLRRYLEFKLSRAPRGSGVDRHPIEDAQCS